MTEIIANMSVNMESGRWKGLYGMWTVTRLRERCSFAAGRTNEVRGEGCKFVTWISPKFLNLPLHYRGNRLSLILFVTTRTSYQANKSTGNSRTPPLPSAGNGTVRLGGQQLRTSSTGFSISCGVSQGEKLAHSSFLKNSPGQTPGLSGASVNRQVPAVSVFFFCWRKKKRRRRKEEG